VSEPQWKDFYLNRAERRKQEREEVKELRKTLIGGNGIFWDLSEDGYIHLKSEEEVAKALGVSQQLLRELDPFNKVKTCIM